MSLLALPMEIHLEILLFCNELDLFSSISRLSTYWRKLIELKYKEFFTTKLHYFLQNYLLEIAKDLFYTQTNMTETSNQSTNDVNVMKIIITNKIFNNLLLYNYIKQDKTYINKENNTGLFKNLFFTKKKQEEKINTDIVYTINNNQFSKFKVIRVSMIGGPEVGKSTFCELLQKGIFKEIYIPTMVTEFVIKRYHLEIDNIFNCQSKISLNNQNFKIQLWDLPRVGLSRLNVNAEYYFRGTNCFLFFFDLTKESSLHYLEENFEILKTMNAFGLLVGTKCDLIESKTNTVVEKTKSLAKRIGIPYLAISSKLNVNVDIILIYFTLIKYLYSSPKEANWF
ncbi:hypothetical protein ABK040_001168 [Willaertia magna]